MRTRFALVLLAAVAATSCSNVDLKASSRLDPTITGWFDAGVTSDGKNKLVPSVTFTVTNTGQAPLPFYFEYLLVLFGFPIDYLMLKTSTALIGMLAIPAMYVVGRELGGTPLGLVAAALCAWSKWPTLGARRGLTFAWAVFPAALFLAAILRYMRRGDRRSVLSAGFWLGLGQYGYNAFKIVPAMVPLAFGLCLLDRRWKRHRGRLVRDGLLVVATSLLVFLPLLQYMLQRPQDFWYRAMTRAGSQERPLPGPPFLSRRRAGLRLRCFAT